MSNAGNYDQETTLVRKRFRDMWLRRRSYLLVVWMIWFSPSQAQAEEITGAGSSFAAPIYGAWGEAIKKSHHLYVNYQSVGSGAGVNQMIAGTVDFGATDKPLDIATLSANHLYQFPSVMGAIVIIAHLPGLDVSRLRLDGPTLAGIFDGTILDWDDPRIRRLNPDLKLPETSVAPMHRADASGTSFVFTSYLSKVSKHWKSAIGAGASVAWPGGAGARGNDGVAAGVRQTDGGIGYVEYAYAKQNHLSVIALKNRSGAFITPDMVSFEAASSAAQWQRAKGNVVDLLDTTSPGGWPIMSATYVLVPRDHVKSAVKSFFAAGLMDGDVEARGLDYVPLPQMVKAKIFADWPDETAKQPRD